MIYGGESPPVCLSQHTRYAAHPRSKAAGRGLKVPQLVGKVSTAACVQILPSRFSRVDQFFETSVSIHYRSAHGKAAKNLPRDSQRRQRVPSTNMGEQVIQASEPGNKISQCLL